MPACVASLAIARVKRVAAEQGVARAFEGMIARCVARFEAMLTEPVAEMLFLALSLRVAETGDDGLVAENERGVGGKDHVGQTGDRRDEGDLRLGRDKRVVELPPLFDSRGEIRLPGD